MQVREVHEFYGDMIPLAPHLCSLGIPKTYENPFNMSPTTFRRCLHGLIGVFLSLKKKPVIRCDADSTPGPNHPFLDTKKRHEMRSG